MYKLVVLMVLFVSSPSLIIGVFSLAIYPSNRSSIETQTFRGVVTSSPPVFTSSVQPTNSYRDLYRNFYRDPSWTVGENFTIRINMRDAVNIYAWQVIVTFDPNHLVIIGIGAGNFLGSKFLVVNSTSRYFPENPEIFIGDAILCYAFDVAPGVLLIGASRIGNVTGSSGSGTLAIITFGVWSHVTQPNRNANLKEPVLLDDMLAETNQASIIIENDY